LRVYVKRHKCISFVNPKGGTGKTTILNFDFGKQWGGDVVMKVLVVEDNPLNMELVLEVLDSNGFTAHGWGRNSPDDTGGQGPALPVILSPDR